MAAFIYVTKDFLDIICVLEISSLDLVSSLLSSFSYFQLVFIFLISSLLLTESASTTIPKKKGAHTMYPVIYATLIAPPTFNKMLQFQMCFHWLFCRNINLRQVANGRTLYEWTNGVDDVAASAPMGNGTHERGGKIFWKGVRTPGVARGLMKPAWPPLDVPRSGTVSRKCVCQKQVSDLVQI